MPRAQPARVLPTSELREDLASHLDAAESGNPAVITLHGHPIVPLDGLSGWPAFLRDALAAHERLRQGEATYEDVDVDHRCPESSDTGQGGECSERAAFLGAGCLSGCTGGSTS